MKLLILPQINVFLYIWILLELYFVGKTMQKTTRYHLFFLLIIVCVLLTVFRLFDKIYFALLIFLPKPIFKMHKKRSLQPAKNKIYLYAIVFISCSFFFFPV